MCPLTLGKLVNMALLFPCAPSTTVAFWMHLPFHRTKGAILLILWLIVGSTIFITGSGLCTAGRDLSLLLSLPVDSHRTWYCFEGVHTTITQIRTRDHCLQQHGLPTATFRGSVFHHYQRFLFLPPRHRRHRWTLPTGDECPQDSLYGLRRTHTAFCCVKDGTNCDRPRATVPVIVAQLVTLLPANAVVKAIVMPFQSMNKRRLNPPPRVPLFWMVQCCGVLLGLLEHRGDPVVHDDGDRSSASKVKGGGNGVHWVGESQKFEHHSRGINLDCMIDQERSLVWRRRKKKRSESAFSNC